MNKDEALKIASSISYRYYSDEAKKLINDIYDDFENRNCKSCKYFLNKMSEWEVKYD